MNPKLKEKISESLSAVLPITLIVAANDKKKAIMQAISDKCGLHSDAKGLILSLPVDGIIGLAEAE